jgi:hypothetical protein
MTQGFRSFFARSETHPPMHVSRQNPMNSNKTGAGRPVDEKPSDKSINSPSLGRG